MFYLTHNLGLSLKLSQEQKQRVTQHLLGLQLALIQAIHDERYEPRATCPECSRKLSPVEIISGFSDDPYDFTTLCTNCSNRFEARLICFRKGGNIEIPFYCGIQSLEKLKSMEDQTPEEISREEPGAYRSAIVHYGGLKKAFEELGIEYTFEEIHDWKTKVTPFLGKLSDVKIANAASVSVYSVRSLRKKLQIERFTIEKTLDNLE